MELFYKLKKVNNCIEVTKDDLPLACPIDINTKYIHPKIYLPIQQAKILQCPYCKIYYKFVERSNTLENE